MSMTNRLKQYLENNDVPYVHQRHPLAYTAQAVAAAQHVPGKEMAKTIVMKASGQFILVVLPALWKIDLQALRAQLPFKDIELAHENEFAWLFPDCQVGAMAPFGNLYSLPVYVDKTLAEDDEIVFNAGTHQDTIRIKFRDFERLVQPQIISVAAMPVEH